jgi:Lrp/AsnC family transcriptional regulator for asnA, asnC and gidA
MDELDKKILKILSKDARTPFSKIGNALGVSADLVRKRYNKMKKNKKLNLKTSITFDPRKVGFKIIMGFSIKVTNRSSIPKVTDELLNCPNSAGQSEQIGDYDFYFDTFIAKIEDITEIVAYLRQIKEIEVIDPWFYHFKPDQRIPFIYEQFIKKID